ncbi:Signal transduction histidine-protein kinase BarA [Polaribacter huanghezhanensis]|uniref:PAS domain S-box protein n=1 Tax=Polaribacter huanghezhanensis TaxID=1354726 RepID=UPI002649D2C5|nr:PAS domain S-box protein [Polaribacter huanghezhanensis]WKD86170.1 Signal transduction histidine-protein kinase BarA [Polaribacter huanghezhanensis]
MNKHLTLKKEFQKLLQEHPHLYVWLTEDILYGVWYCNFKNPDEFFINDAFKKTLKHPPLKVQGPSVSFTDILTPKEKKKIEKQVRSCQKSVSGNFDALFQFKNYQNETIVLRAIGKTILEESGSKKGLIIKFLNPDIFENQTLDLKKKTLALEKLQKIYDETNEIARVGGWEVDLVAGSVNWTKVTKDIHEVEQTYNPDLATGINFYKEGHYRDLITKLVNDAVEKGTPFDTELKIVTAKGNEIWVRSFGKPEFEEGKCVRIYGAFQDINDKKKRELQMKETKEHFEKIFTNSSIGMLLVNTDNKVIMVNQAIYEIFEFKKSDKEKILNLTFRDLLHSDYVEKAILNRQKLLAGKISSYKTEARYSTAKGKMIWCATSSAMVRGHSGSEDLIITQVEDITKRKELEHLALENSNKFMNAFEYSPNGMGVVSISGKWLMINKNLSQMIGYSKEELLLLRSKEITHKDDLYNDTEFLRELISQKRESYSVKKRYIHKNGKIVYCFLNVSLLTDKYGKPTSLIGQVVDMTESIKSERELKETLNDLQNLLAATTHVSIIETDLNGIARKFNKGAENLLGYKADDVVGSLNVGVLHDPTEVAKKGLELSNKYKKEITGFNVFIHKANFGEHDSSEWTYIRKNGKRFPVQLVVTAIKNAEGEITGYLGVATDISKLKEMEISLVKAKLKAEAASKSKSEFLANMSHEIRTPLNGVIGFTDLLMRTKLSDIQKKYMHTVYNSANVLLDLLSDILDFSKIEAGKLEISIGRTDLVKLCGQTIDIIRHQAHEKGLEVLLNIPPNTNRFIQADSVRLRQVLTNLLGNAVKFTETGEIELKIRSKPNPNNKKEMLYKFSIRDTGVGIAPKNLKKIFTAFDQEDASTTRKYGGTGLGLTISNKLLQLMNSQLVVESKLSVGSTFSFTVSFEIEKEENHKVRRSKSIKNILIIDDNFNNRTILENMLAIDKIDSTLFANGVDAIEFLEKENPFDLAIIDYHMPHIDGLELIRHFREKMSLTSVDLPIILLHSSGDDKKIHKVCKDLDVQFNVVKPIQMNTLFELIGKIDDPLIKVKQEESDVEGVDLSQRSFNILVAEDNPVNKFLSKVIIQKILPKATIYEANDGLEAVRFYEIKEIDLIFMDIQMPNMSGFEATEQIRKMEKGKEHIPIIALTARTVKGEKERSLENGMDDYITKPVILETIKKAIIEFLVKPQK